MPTTNTPPRSVARAARAEGRKREALIGGSASGGGKAVWFSLIVNLVHGSTRLHEGQDRRTRFRQFGLIVKKGEGGAGSGRRMASREHGACHRWTCEGTGIQGRRGDWLDPLPSGLRPSPGMTALTAHY